MASNIREIERNLKTISLSLHFSEMVSFLSYFIKILTWGRLVLTAGRIEW